jgi:hypothetical protein
MTFAPSLAKKVAAAAPMPLAAPVTIATLLFNNLSNDLLVSTKVLFMLTTCPVMK